MRQVTAEAAVAPQQPSSASTVTVCGRASLFLRRLAAAVGMMPALSRCVRKFSATPRGFGVIQQAIDGVRLSNPPPENLVASGWQQQVCSSRSGLDLRTRGEDSSAITAGHRGKLPLPVRCCATLRKWMLRGLVSRGALTRSSSSLRPPHRSLRRQMSKLVGSVDQGTSSTRFILFDEVRRRSAAVSSPRRSAGASRAALSVPPAPRCA